MSTTFSSCLATARQQFYEAVRDLHRVKEKPGIEQRLQEVNELVEGYFAITGEVPQPKPVGRLADYLLIDILTDQYKHFRNDEFPIQTKGQVDKRNQRHGHVEYKDEIGRKTG